VGKRFCDVLQTNADQAFQGLVCWRRSQYLIGLRKGSWHGWGERGLQQAMQGETDLHNAVDHGRAEGTIARGLLQTSSGLSLSLPWLSRVKIVAHATKRFSTDVHVHSQREEGFEGGTQCFI